MLAYHTTQNSLTPQRSHKEACIDHQHQSLTVDQQWQDTTDTTSIQWHSCESHSISQHAFSHAGATAWNLLPPDIAAAASPSVL